MTNRDKIQVPWVAPSLDSYRLESTTPAGESTHADPVAALGVSGAANDAQLYLDVRRHPRSKCFLAVELRSEGNAGLLIGNLSDVSLSGCCVETNRLRERGTTVAITPLDADGLVWVRGVVMNTRIVEGSAIFKIGIQFIDEGPASPLQDFLQHVVDASAKQSHIDSSTYLRWLGGH